MILLDAIFALFLYAKQPDEKTISPIAEDGIVYVIDPRITTLQTFFEKKQSPLVDSAATFIEVADYYGLDWKLLPAIAGVESGFEKAGNTSDFNPFGYMCNDHPCRFSSFDQAIRRVARTLGTGIAYKGYRETGSLYILAEVYNHCSPEDWSKKIIYFEEQIRR